MIRNSGNFDGKILKALQEKIEALKKVKVVVGVPASKNHRDDETGRSNAEVAAAHEFGVPGHIPERSFLRSTLQENKEGAVRFLVNGIRQALEDNTDTKQPFELVGRQMAGQVQRNIQAGINPPLNPKTIKRKKSSKPLLDTGQLLQSITYEVREDG
ncbi:MULTISPECIES: hypothetical protein [Xenorhabdus]|uniref:hypothetical protein n=1 Tax=Xenorhabdus TaxID=626 RepID=UPI00064B53E1|nr:MULTISPECIES: hypothetical protein [Xenorhabdus]KLU15081.1 hypothetical protein AAY47_12880 [Xenorhabdus griffiniae]KOP32294.1 hypothetical protein AFK69_16160 [Xenorhabdus sp. GDc328]